MAVERSRCYKVSEITKCIKDYLEGEFYSIQIEGEVSGFKPSSSGHFYFTLKDTSAAISAVLFPGRPRMQVICRRMETWLLLQAI